MRYQEAFSKRSSPLMRWVLSPFLLLFAGLFVLHLRETMEDGPHAGTIICAGLIIACLAGILASWGVPLMGRIVSGLVALAFGSYVVHECILDFDGNWGWGGPKSGTTPINSILGFLVFGLPCLCYTILGRFTLRKEPDYEYSEEESDMEWSDDDQVTEKKEQQRE